MFTYYYLTFPACSMLSNFYVAVCSGAVIYRYLIDLKSLSCVFGTRNEIALQIDRINHTPSVINSS